MKFKLTKLEKQAFQKNGDSAKFTSRLPDGELVNLYKNIEILKSRLQSMELDVKFKEAKANAAFKVKLKNVAEEKRLVRSRAVVSKESVKKLSSSKPQTKGYDETMWNVIKFSSNVAKRMLPKDILVEYCKKKKLGAPAFKTINIGSGLWRSSVKIEETAKFNQSYEFELPAFTGASTSEHSKQLIAV
jgi:hypothetical protein